MNEIILYQSDDLAERVEVRVDETIETVWLTQQQQMAELFGRGRSTITEHINNIFKEGELIEEVVCRGFRHTTQQSLNEYRNTYSYYGNRCLFKQVV